MDQHIKGIIRLNWITSSEVNNDYFTIERSVDGKNFTSIGILKSKGNSTEDTYYQYEDKDFPQGQLYYRLLQTDYDGSSKYSKIIGIQGKDAAHKVTIFPSPSSEFIAIQASGLVTSLMRIQLYDLNGSLLRETQILPGSTISFMDIQTLYNGTYIVKVSDGSHNSMHKINVVH